MSIVIGEGQLLEQVKSFEGVVVKSSNVNPPFLWRLGNPPSKGEYLVTQKVGDTVFDEPPKEMRQVLMLHWDGYQWCEFCSVKGDGEPSDTKEFPVLAWMFLPSCYEATS